MSTTTKVHTIRREVCAATAQAIRAELEAARAAGVLTGFDGAFAYDADAGEAIAIISARSMHPADRGSFSCECAVADALVARAIARHRGPSSPPRGT